MILGPDGKKLSKRHGAASVEEFCERGYLPDAMVNFLALLGWSLDGETTLIDRETLCEKFSLDRVTKKDAVVRRDEARLDERPVHQGDGRERVGARIAAVAARRTSQRQPPAAIGPRERLRRAADRSDVQSAPEWYCDSTRSWPSA